VLVKNKITGFNELTGPDTHAIADGADDFAVACKFEELPILAAPIQGLPSLSKCSAQTRFRIDRVFLNIPLAVTAVQDRTGL
jgi:hypothetical protein